MKVYYNSGFWKHRGRDKAGVEIPVNKHFIWNDVRWQIPAVYACGAGLVVDYCVQIEPEKIKVFMEKWEAAAEHEEHLSAEELELLEAENPMNVAFLSAVSVNGKVLERKAGCSISWIPEAIRTQGIRNVEEAKQIMQQYRLDHDKGWVIFRNSYSWAGKRKPVLKMLQVNLEQRPIPVMAGTWKSPAIEDKITVKHPVTGKIHEIVVRDVEKQELNLDKSYVKSLHGEEYEYPRYFTMMAYTIAPELPPHEFGISDCLQSDSPRRKKTGHAGVAAIGIIGRGDGPTAIFISGLKGASKLCSACSALHFEPREEVEWKLVFRVKTCEDISVRLI